MNSLSLQIIAFLPVFLASPTMYAGVVLIMSTGVHTRLRIVAAFVGTVLAVIVVGAIAIAVGGATSSPRGPSTLSEIIDIVLGTILILLAAWVLFRKKPRAGKKKNEKSGEEGDSSPQFFKYTGIGILLVVTNPTSLTALFASAKLTVDSGLATSDQLIAMLLAGLFFTLPVLIPLVLILVAPAACRKFLDAANRILDRYGRYVIAVILVLLGINLIQKGLEILG